MAHINMTQLINNATYASALVDRAYQVQQDPAVQKTWSEACSDLAKSFRSLRTAIDETRAAWRRTDTSGGSSLARSYA